MQLDDYGFTFLVLGRDCFGGKDQVNMGRDVSMFTNVGVTLGRAFMIVEGNAG